MPRKKPLSADDENLSNAAAAAAVESRQRRKAAPLQGHWAAKRSSFTPEKKMSKEEEINNKRKRNLSATSNDDRSVRPRLASSTSSSLQSFLSKADPKFKREMHLCMSQQACTSNGNTPLQGINGSIFQDTIVQEAFEEFNKLSPCVECQAQDETVRKRWIRACDE